MSRGTALQFPSGHPEWPPGQAAAYSGDSLLVARMLACVSQRLDVDLDLLDFLDAPTIADQAVMLAEKLG